MGENGIDADRDLDGPPNYSGSHDKTIKLWDINNGKEIQTFKGHKSPVWSVAISSDGKKLII